MARLLFTARAFGTLTEENNRLQLRNFLGTKNVAFMRQNHGDNFQIINTQATTNQSVITSEDGTDALITTDKDVALCVMVADCLPVLIDGQNVVAAVHVGRRGLMNEITLKVLEKMKSMGAEFKSITVGPHICGNCYPLDEATATEVWRKYPSSKIFNSDIETKPTTSVKTAKTMSSTFCVDLYQGLVSQIGSSNLRANLNIRRVGGCTFEKIQYFSHRASRDIGRQVGVISL